MRSLFAAVRNGNVSVVQAFYLARPAAFVALDAEHRSVWSYAANSQSAALLQVLLQATSDRAHELTCTKPASGKAAPLELAISMNNHIFVDTVCTWLSVREFPECNGAVAAYYIALKVCVVARLCVCVCMRVCCSLHVPRCVLTFKSCELAFDCVQALRAAFMKGCVGAVVALTEACAQWAHHVRDPSDVKDIRSQGMATACEAGHVSLVQYLLDTGTKLPFAWATGLSTGQIPASKVQMPVCLCVSMYSSMNVRMFVS